MLIKVVTYFVLATVSILLFSGCTTPPDERTETTLIKYLGVPESWAEAGLEFNEIEQFAVAEVSISQGGHYTKDGDRIGELAMGEVATGALVISHFGNKYYFKCREVIGFTCQVLLMAEVPASKNISTNLVDFTEYSTTPDSWAAYSFVPIEEFRNNVFHVTFGGSYFKSSDTIGGSHSGDIYSGQGLRVVFEDETYLFRCEKPVEQRCAQVSMAVK